MSNSIPLSPTDLNTFDLGKPTTNPILDIPLNKMINSSCPVLPLAICSLSFTSLQGAVLLSTDFSGRSVSGKTATNITWTSSGLSAPSSMTAVDETPTSGAFSALFNTANAQGHFAPDKNIGNEGPWSTTLTLTLTSPDISLESIDIDWQHFNNGGSFQGATTNRQVRWTATVTGSTSGVIGTASDSANAVSGTNTLTFGSALSLSDSETYDVELFVDNNGNTTGNNTGFDGLAFNGAIVPEPGSLILVGMSSIFLLKRRRS